jgi:hypothetical protein
MYTMVAKEVDIAFVMSMVKQFMANDCPPHWMAVKRIMKYRSVKLFQYTLDFKLYLGSKNITLRGFCDADWAEDAIDQQSTMRYIIFC